MIEIVDLLRDPLSSLYMICYLCIQ